MPLPMKSLRLAVTCLLAAPFSTAVATAVTLYTGALDGKLSTLRLSNVRGNYSLEQVRVSDACGSVPAWLDLDRQDNLLYCLDRSGAASTFRVSPTGDLSRLDLKNTTVGPVSNGFYNKGNKRGMALAHYAGNVVTAWNAPPSGSLELIQTLKFNVSTPGPDPAQNLSHPHDVIVDPTGKYIVVPDLGADLLRIFSFDSHTNLLTEIDTVKTAPGSGPRHGVFWSPLPKFSGRGPLYFHALAELDGTITSFRVTYPPGGGIEFVEVGVANSYPFPSGALSVASAEIEVSPDNRFIVTSNRNDSAYVIPSLSPGSNSSTEVSDSLGVFRPLENGTLSLVHHVPAGGLWPRHLKINKAGDLVAVSLQNSKRVTILKRDVKSGKLGPLVAHVDNVGEAVVTVWDE